MHNADFQKALRKAIAYYAAGAPEYSHLMDELSIACTDKQWQQIEEAIDEVDEVLSESAIGTLYQKESVAAKREGRPSRYPSVFETDETKRSQMIAALEKDYRAKGIPFRSEDQE